MENPDDRREPPLIDLHSSEWHRGEPRPQEPPPGKAPSRGHEISPYWVVSMVAILFGLNIQNHGLPNTDPWDIGAFVVVAIFLAWNYWPRAPR